MYVGHALLAFVAAAVVAGHGAPGRSQALTVGLLAACFAVLPDVDAVHTLYAVVQARPEAVFPTPANVWTPEAWQMHRALTHSLVVGGVTSVGAGALALAARWRPDARAGSLVAAFVATCAFAGVLVTGATTDGLAGLGTAVLYVVGAAALVTWAVRRHVTPGWTWASAAIGLLTHPFGDLFMGRPPAVLYPLTAVPPLPKLALAPEPTVNLVGLFGLEVALAWGALATVASVRGWRLRDALAPRAGLAVGFAGAALVIQPPTLRIAYHFALGTIGTGLVLGVAAPAVRGRLGPGDVRIRRRTGVVTSLAAVSLALVAYLLAYLALGA